MEAKALRRLAEDGLEDLGTIVLDGTVVAGDPTLLVEPVGVRRWWGAALRPGTWRVLGRPWPVDRDLLEEVVLVHEDLLPSFYGLYDEAEEQTTLILPTGRLAVLTGSLRTDPDTLRAAVSAEAEGLPWVLDRGLVIGAIAQNAAQVATAGGSELGLFTIGLSRPPEHRAQTAGYTSQDRDED